MSHNKKPRKAYRPRHVAIDTMQVALHRAAKPSRDDRAEILAKLDGAVRALCTGMATELDWSIAAGSLAVATAIERQGVVRGLQEHLAVIEQVLQAIYDRCRLPALWLRPVLAVQEVDAVRLLLELHAFQLGQLGRAELLAAMGAAERDTLAQGHRATVVRDIERMAA